MDVFYIDESHDRNTYVVTAIAVPLIRPTPSGVDISWPDQFEAAKAWRKQVADKHSIPRSKELHGVKLASGRGNLLRGKHNFSRKQATSVYRAILRSLAFLPDASILSASATRGDSIFGHERLENAMLKLFQRMRTQCENKQVNAMVFFDQGHPEYRKLYRKAQVYLPTGSQIGAWSDGKSTKNMPMSMFFKDGNEKSSADSLFVQIADLIAYAAFLKRKGEIGALTDWQAEHDLGSLYDELPRAKLNTNAQKRGVRDGIVR